MSSKKETSKKANQAPDSDEDRDYEGEQLVDEDEEEDDAHMWNVQKTASLYPARPKADDTADFVQGAHQYDDPSEKSRNAGSPDSIWMVPANVEIKHIFGQNEIHKKKIEEITGCYLEYIQDSSQVYIYGNETQANNAKAQLDNFKNIILKKLDSEHKRVTGWAKADKPLSEKAKKYMERKKEKEMAAMVYLQEGDAKQPPEPQLFNGVFMIPDTKINPQKWVGGERESLLNEIRKNEKLWIWYEPGENIVRIAGSQREPVGVATSRVKNLYLKVARKHIRLPEVENVLKAYILDPPGIEETAIKFISPNRNYRRPYILDPDQPTPVFMEYMKSDESEDYKSISKQTSSLNRKARSEALIDFGDNDPAIDEKEERRIEVEERREYLSDRLREQIRLLIGGQLEELRLFEHQIRMKVRFGNFCAVNHPKKITEPFAIDKISNKMETKVFQGFIDTTIALDLNSLNDLFVHLNKVGDELFNSPHHSFRLQVQEIVTIPPPRSRGEPRNNRQPARPKTKPLDLVLDVTLREDGRIGSWTACFPEKIVTEVDVACPGGNFSWGITLGASERRPKENIESFIKKLRLDDEKRLIYSNTENVHVKSVIQKTRWLWELKGYHKNTIIEVTKNEYWELDEEISPGLETLLGKPNDETTKPWGVTSFSVALYRKVWRNFFAENLVLDLGHATSWSSASFFEDPNENLEILLASVREFLVALNENVNGYWRLKDY